MKTEPETARRGGAASSSTRVKRFRATHRRIDYVPRPDALKVIDTWCGTNPSLSRSSVIDHLVIAGNAALVAIPTMPVAEAAPKYGLITMAMD